MKLYSRLLGYLVVALLPILLISGGAMAQTDPATELADLEHQKKVAEARKAIAEAAAAEKAALDKLKPAKEDLPQPTDASKPLGGDVDISDTSIFEPQLEAFASVTTVSKAIATAVASSFRDSDERSVMIFSAADARALAARLQFKTEKERLEAAYEKLGNEIDDAQKLAVAETLVAATITARLVADFVALFREDVSLKGRAVTVPDEALVSMVAASLQKENIGVIHAALWPADLFGESAITQAAKLVDAPLNELRAKAQGLRARIEALEKANAAALKANPQDETAKKQAPLIAAWKEKLASIDKEREAYIATLQAKPAVDATAPLLDIVRGAVLEDRLEKGAKVLYLKVVGAGGGYVVRKSLWMRHAKVSASGGVVANYMLFDKTGKVAASGIEQALGERDVLRVTR